MKVLTNTLILIVLMVLFNPLSAQDIEGTWNLVGMKSGKTRSTLEFYQVGKKFQGKVIKVFPAPGDDENPICEKCPGDRNGKPVLGMDLITGLEWDSRRQEFINGKIIDPTSGSEYSCRAWFDGEDRLVVRGYVMFFYKTYILPRVDD